MLDNGFPLATELNILTELIKPPTIINKAVSMVTGKEGSVFILLSSTTFKVYLIMYSGVSYSWD